jgi:hypothetical protein
MEIVLILKPKITLETMDEGLFVGTLTLPQVGAHNNSFVRYLVEDDDFLSNMIEPLHLHSVFYNDTNGRLVLKARYDGYVSRNIIDTVTSSIESAVDVVPEVKFGYLLCTAQISYKVLAINENEFR